MAAAGSNASEELMRFAANLTIDNEEYAQFTSEPQKTSVAKKLPVNASTQAIAAQDNFDRAADRNNFDMLALFAKGVETTPPGQ